MLDAAKKNQSDGPWQEMLCIGRRERKSVMSMLKDPISANILATEEGGMGVTQRGWRGQDIDIEGWGGGLRPPCRGGVQCRVCCLP